MIIILLIIGLLLDGLLTSCIPNTSLFIPLITISNIFLIYNFYKKNERTYFILIALTGLIYDMLYTNLFLFHLIIFSVIGVLSKYIYKYFKITKVKILFFIPLIIASFELLTASTLFLFQIIPLDISRLTYKISHSLILNIIYAEIIYLSFEKIKKA